MEILTEHYIDAKGLPCPLPVLRFKKFIKNLNSGEIIRIEATDPDSVKDFETFSEMKGFCILAMENRDSVFRFDIKI